MANQETGKLRASRIPLDYFKHPNRLERWKTGLLWLAVVGSAAWAATGFLPGSLAHSRGPVAAVHATWENNCNACHIDFQPIRGETSIPLISGDVHTSNQKCRTCHEGPAHHGHRTADGKIQELACGSCHRDHRGHAASLIRGFDNDCTQCHRHEVAGLMRLGKVTRFDQDHPVKFRSLKDGDPGKLKFNHALHMTPGLSRAKDGKPLTLGQIEKGYRERYEQAQPEKGDQALVRLDCTSCHQTESADFQATRAQLADVPGAVLPARSGGQYMQPITYENQCRACHPLTVESESKGFKLTVPHRLQPEEMQTFLKRAVLGDLLEKQKEPKLTEWLQKPRPGRSVAEAPQALQTLVAERVKEASKLLWLGQHTCGECHHYEADPKQPVIPARVVPTEVPALWLKHARFDHRAHRAVNCRECHEQAYTSTQSSDVLLSGGKTPDNEVAVADIKKCQECHSPVRQERGITMGGARFDCAECHRYHQGDDWLQGLGSRARAPQNRLDLKSFLSGKR